MKPLPYGRHHITNEDIEAVVGVLKSDFLTQGPAVAEFEKALADFLGAKHAIVVNNGTAALHLAASVLDVMMGDWVVCTPNTFAASANAIRYCGGEVEFSDINPKTLCLDLELLELKIKGSKNRFKGIVATDYAGYAMDFEALRKIADRHGMWLIEDACHALGAEFTDSRGQWVKSGNGAYADMSVFSFHPVKHIATGEGGAVITNNDNHAAHLRLLRTHGITKAPDSWIQEMHALGYNYRMSDINAALGASQLKRISANLDRRRQIAARYDRAFAPRGWVTPPPNNVRHAYHLYVVQVPKRKELYQHLKTKNIFPQVHYVPVHDHPYYINRYRPQPKLHQAEAYYEQTLSLPMYPQLTDQEVDYVIDAVCGFYDGK